MQASRQIEPSRLHVFRDCFEAGMDFETAIGCAGLDTCNIATKEVLRRTWDRWERRFNS